MASDVFLTQTDINTEENVNISLMDSQKGGFMKFAKCLVLLVMLCSIFGCTKFSYNNKTYSSPDDALVAQGKHLSEIESKITRSTKKYNKTALVVTPSSKTCEALGVISKGHASSELTGYVADTLKNDYRKFSDYIIKRNMFTSVKSVIDDFPKVAADEAKNQYDVVVYMNLISPNQAGWFAMVKPDYNPQQINFNKIAEPGAPKVESWLDNLDKLISKSN